MASSLLIDVVEIAIILILLLYILIWDGRFRRRLSRQAWHWG